LIALQTNFSSKFSKWLYSDFILDRGSKSIESTSHAASSAGHATPLSILSSSSPAAIAEANWLFVAELLRECKAKTKRILLEKLGQEAIQWGHGNEMATVSGKSEQNDN